MSAFLFPECPEHKEELRIERNHGVRHGYCAKCKKYYPLCAEELRGALCQQLQGHEDKHRDARH